MAKDKTKNDPPAQPHADAALVLQPPPWGDGEDDGGVDTLRGRVMRLLHASAGPASLELAQWLEPVGSPPWPVAAWLALMALQRPTFLQAVALGYKIPGHVAMACVRDATAEKAKVPVVTYLRTTDGQVAVRFDWEDETLCFLRAPVLRSAACSSLAISPDAWQQLDVEELVAKAAPDGDVATEIARLAPGRLDPGEVQPPGNLDLAQAFFWLAMTDAERQTVRAALPPYPSWEHERANADYVDRKAMAVEEKKPDPPPAAPSGTPPSPARPTSSSSGSATSPSAPAATSSPASGSCASAAGGSGGSCRAAVVARKLGATHFLETLCHPATHPKGRTDLILWIEKVCPVTQAPMSAAGPGHRLEGVLNEDVLWARANLRRMGSLPHEGAPDGTCATCARAAGQPVVRAECLVCEALRPPVFRGRCLQCQEKVEAGDVKGLDPPTEKDRREVYMARLDARMQAKACKANPEARHELHQQANAALTRTEPPREEQEVPEAAVPEEHEGEPAQEVTTDAPAQEWEKPAAQPGDVDRDAEGFPLVSVLSCPCGHNQFMPTSEAKKMAPKGCPTCGRDASAVTVVETGSGTRWTGTDLAVAAKDPDPAAGHPTPQGRAQGQTPQQVLEEINGPKVAKDLEPDMAYRSSSGGRCEWAPMSGTRATIKVPGCVHDATLLVGARDPWRLCASCAELPCFRRKGKTPLVTA